MTAKVQKILYIYKKMCEKMENLEILLWKNGNSKILLYLYVKF